MGKGREEEELQNRKKGRPAKNSAGGGELQAKVGTVVPAFQKAKPGIRPLGAC